MGGLIACLAALAHSQQWGVVVTALGCCAANGYLLARKIAAVSQKRALCNISDTINCDAVNTSQYSELWGIPITLIGLCFFAALAIVALRPAGKTPAFIAATFVFTGASVLYSLFLGWASVQIGAVCLFCIWIYLANGLLFGNAWSQLRTLGISWQAPLRGLPGNKAAQTLSVAFVVLFAIGALATRSQTVDPIEPIDPSSPSSLTRLATLYQKPGGTVVLDGTEPILGDPEAPYLVVEWADFQCPHCAKASRELKHLVEERPELQVRFKAFPLTSDCNPALEDSRGPGSCYAAVAAECAHRQGAFWRYSDLVFKNLGYVDMDHLRFMAEQAELDVASWETCLQDPQTAQSVVEDAIAGAQAEIGGTPALFLRGTHDEAFIEVLMGPEAVLAIVDAHASGAALPPAPPARPQ